jgi:hypothetical protein
MFIEAIDALPKLGVRRFPAPDNFVRMLSNRS